MTINMGDHFEKLKDIVMHRVDNFYFSRSQYFGPVDPTSIVTFGSNIIRMNALVLAEAVPAFYLPIKSGQNLYEAVIVHLDEKFEFTSYDPYERALGELNVLIGNAEYYYDGTIEQAKAYFKAMNWTFDIVYRRDLHN
ncbi:MAG: hypothetical protein AB1638_08815 [Nitrospirota bacterium]